jgi:hypothetical protein
MEELLIKWQYKLGIEDWKIEFESIDSEQVMFPDDIGDDDYFIGVNTVLENKTATIYYDVPLYEEALVHELLHIRYPESGFLNKEKSEEWVNYVTTELLK